MGKKIGKLFHKVPLRFVLIFPFVLQIAIAVGVTGTLSFRNGREGVNKLASQLRQEITARIEQHLDTQLATSHLVNRINLEIVSLGLLKTEDFSKLGKHFWGQLQMFQSIEVIYFGTEGGELIAAQRGNDGSFFFVKRERPFAEAEVYNANDKGQLAGFKKIIPKFIDIRQRPWYSAAKEKGDFTWGNIFALQSSPEITLPASVPLIDSNGNFQGVLSNNLSLGTVSEFLQQLKVGKSGQTFIIERNGLLVASSTLKQPFSIDENGKTNRILAIESKDPLLRTTTTYLLNKFSDFKQINATEQLDFFIGRKRHFIEVLPYKDQWGIDWLIVVVVPESDFMAEIYANTRTTILLCLGALVLATVSGVVTASWVSGPLLRLNQAAKGISQENWQQTFVSESIQEVEELSNSFNQMAMQLQTSFTKLQSLNRELSESESRLSQFLEALPIGILVHDSQGQLTYINQIGQNLLDVEELNVFETKDIAKTFQMYRVQTQELYPTQELPIVRALSGETVQIDDMEIHLGNRKIALEVLATPIIDRHGEIAYAIAAFQDITNRKQAQEQLIYNALHDNLTDLPNRSFLMRRLEIIINRARLYPEYRFAILFLDLDRFKIINDSLGHLAGDRLLIAIAHKLQSVIRSKDLAARLGGDEFVIVIDEIKGIQEAVEVAERIFSELQSPLMLEGREVFVSTSIGIVLGTKDYSQSSDILRDADIAMYQAKTQGKAKYEIFDAQMHTQALKRLHLENDLRKALEQQEFIIYYQPIVALKTGQIVGFEALVRWQHPTQGLTSPAEFITIAEETGLIVPLDCWVLKKACQQIVAWKSKFCNIPLLKVSVNLSVRDLQETNLIEKISQTQDLRNCHKQWRGVTAPRPKRLGDKHGNIRTF